MMMHKIERKELGKLQTGETVTGYTLYGDRGMRVTISDFGGTIWELVVPDRDGKLADVTLGYDSVKNLESSDRYLSTLIGRWANRIGGAEITIDGKKYALPANDGRNHLHGGTVGFDRKFWQAEPIDGEEPELRLTLDSPDGDQGFPGNLRVEVNYRLKNRNSLLIHYRATTDQKTVVNLTNHAYFNLGGFDSGSVLTHELMLDAQDYLATDDELIPTGERVSVAGTPFDFRSPKPLGRDIGCADRALVIGGGYDHCFNFTGLEPSDGEPVFRGYLRDPASGRRMNLYTNQPCVQVYSCNMLAENGNTLKGGVPQKPRIAVCLETQRMPDAMHHDGFTDPYLAPGEVYDYTTIYQFVSE